MMNLLVNTRLPSIHSLLDLPKATKDHQQQIVLPSITNLNLPHVNDSTEFTPNVVAAASSGSSGSTSPSFTLSSTPPYSRSHSLGNDAITQSFPTVLPQYSQTTPPPLQPLVQQQPTIQVQQAPQTGIKIEMQEEQSFMPQTPASQPCSGTASPCAEQLEPKKWKPRKKRQCPECKLFFSNLATHKSTHLNSTSRPHVCEYCSRGFARPNDLFRHIKCHWKEIGSDKGQFKCPYKNHSSGDHCGHNSGIFSRCDTFKNHLKAIHFQYPNGTKKDQRAKSGGSCRMCQVNFESVDDWLTNHLENNSCPYANEYKKKY